MWFEKLITALALLASVAAAPALALGWIPRTRVTAIAAFAALGLGSAARCKVLIHLPPFKSQA